MELRPNLRRIAAVLRDSAPYAAAIDRLGFRAIPELAVTLEGTAHYTAVLDFGPDSVDGWLARLVTAELDTEDCIRWTSTGERWCSTAGASGSRAAGARRVPSPLGLPGQDRDARRAPGGRMGAGRGRHQASTASCLAAVACIDGSVWPYCVSWPYPRSNRRT